MLIKSAIQDRLYRKKRFKLGNGMFSVVHSAKADRVVKVGNLDDAWPMYVLWARQNGYLGTFAPMVYSFRVLGDCYVAICERLEPIPNDDSLLRVVSQLCNYREEMPEPYTSFGRDLKSSLLTSGKAKHDLGVTNVMLRRDVIVINDPIYRPDYSCLVECQRDLVDLYARREPIACKLQRPCPWQDIQIGQHP